MVTKKGPARKRQRQQSKKESKEEIGKVYRISNSVNKMIYIGETIMKLNRRWHLHVKEARATTERPLYEDMRSLGHEKFKIEEIESIVQPAGTTRKDFKVKLRALQDSHIAKYDPKTLYNVILDGTYGEASKKKSTARKKARTSEESKIVTDRQSQAQTKRGHIRQTGRSWRFSWRQNRKLKSVSFDTKEEALQAQTEMYGPEKEESGDEEFCYVYELYNLMDAEDKMYIGETGQKKLSSRMRTHRSDARKRIDAFHSHMMDTGVFSWDVRIIYQFPAESVTKDELLALEQYVIQQRNPARLWNTPKVYGGFTIYKCWVVSTEKGTKSNRFLITKSRTSQEAKAEATKFQKQQEAAKRSVGAVKFSKTCKAAITFRGERTCTSSVDESKIKAWLENEGNKIRAIERETALAVLERSSTKTKNSQ